MQCKHATNMHIRKKTYKIIGYLPLYISICIISEHLTVTSVCLLKNFHMKRHHQVNICSRTTYQEASSDVGSGWRSFPASGALEWSGWTWRLLRAACCVLVVPAGPPCLNRHHCSHLSVRVSNDTLTAESACVNRPYKWYNCSWGSRSACTSTPALPMPVFTFLPFLQTFQTFHHIKITSKH